MYLLGKSLNFVRSSKDYYGMKTTKNNNFNSRAYFLFTFISHVNYDVEEAHNLPFTLGQVVFPCDAMGLCIFFLIL